jgi:hypothetical protein
VAAPIVVFGYRFRLAKLVITNLLT